MDSTEISVRIVGGLCVLFVCLAVMVFGVWRLWRLRRSTAFVVPAGYVLLVLVSLFAGGVAFVVFRGGYAIREAKVYAVECVELLQAGGVPAISPNASPETRANIVALADNPPPTPVEIEVVDECVLFYHLRLVPESGPAYLLRINREGDTVADWVLPAEFQVSHLGWPAQDNGAWQASTSDDLSVIPQN